MDLGTADEVQAYVHGRTESFRESFLLSCHVAARQIVGYSSKYLSRS